MQTKYILGRTKSNCCYSIRLRYSKGANPRTVKGLQGQAYQGGLKREIKGLKDNKTKGQCGASKQYTVRFLGKVA